MDHRANLGPPKTVDLGTDLARRYYELLSLCYPLSDPPIFLSLRRLAVGLGFPDADEQQPQSYRQQKWPAQLPVHQRPA